MALEHVPTDELSIVDLEPGTVLTEIGSLDSRLFVVLDGVLSAESGTGVSIGVTFGPGDVVGEVSHLTGIPRTASIVAESAASVVAIASGLEGADIPGLGELAMAHFRASMLIELLTERFDVDDATALRAFAEAAEIDDLPRGAELFESPGEVALVLMGSFTVHGERGAIARARRGEILGEMSWLNGDERAARVTASRHSVVARFDAATFEELVRRHPSALLAVTRILAERLSRDPIYRMSRPPRPLSLAVVAAHADLDAEMVARSLAIALERSAVITANDVNGALARPGASSAQRGTAEALAVDTWLSLEEPRHEIILLAGHASELEWNRRIVRHADRVVMALDASRDTAPTDVERALAPELADTKIDLLLMHPATTSQPTGTVAWFENRAIEHHHHARRGSGPDFARAARRLAGLARGLVLGGGGARGYAVIGVGQALEAADHAVDIIGGTSMGALMGAALAMGGSSFAAGMAERHGSRRELHDTTLPLTSVFASRRVTTMLQEEYGETLIEDMWTPFFAMATNLSTSEETVLDSGPVWQAVRASIAIPGVFSPISRNGDLLVDGGIMNNLPIDVMRLRCEQGPVIAVNVSPHSSEHRWDIAPYQSGWSLLARRLNPFRTTPRMPSIAGTVLRSLDTNSVARLRQYLDLADLVIQPDLEEFSILDWDSYPAVIDAGRDAATRALAGWAELDPS